MIIQLLLIVNKKVKMILDEKLLSYVNASNYLNIVVKLQIVIN